jgi:Ca2+-binding EF-hand superfamily protein
MDINGDSFVTVDEYVALFCGAQAAAPAKPARSGAKKDSFRHADRDGDGAITSVECVASKTTLFKLIDKSKDGKLSREELARNAREEFQKADSNKDGFVALTEWVAFTVEPKVPEKKAAPKKS